MKAHGGVRAGPAALVAVGSGLACWLLLMLWREAGHEFPVLPWIGTVPLLLLAVVVLLTAWQIRRYVHGQGSFHPSPQRARATLVGAQASILGGALLTGWYVANLAVHLPNADVVSVRELLVRAAVSAVVALVLVTAGFVAQWMCRLPPDDDEQERERHRDADPGGLAYG